MHAMVLKSFSTPLEISERRDQLPGPLRWSGWNVWSCTKAARPSLALFRLALAGGRGSDARSDTEPHGKPLRCQDASGEALPPVAHAERPVPHSRWLQHGTPHRRGSGADTSRTDDSRWTWCRDARIAGGDSGIECRDEAAVRGGLDLMVGTEGGGALRCLAFGI